MVTRKCHVVLVIEDEFRVRQLISDSLSQFGYAVGAAATAAEAASSRAPAMRTARERRHRLALAVAAAAGWLGLAIVAVVSVGGLALRGIALAASFVPRAIVWLFLAAQDGADWWSIAGRAGAGLASTIASSQVMWWLIGLELLGVAALAGLQAMLRNESRGQDSEEETQ